MGATKADDGLQIIAHTVALKTLFKVRMEPAGHGGKSGRYERLHDVAFTYSWILSTLGITK